MLLRHEANPGRQVAPGRERLPITHLCDQSGCDDRTDAGDALEPPACFARSVPSVDALLDGCDLCCDGYVLASKNIEAEPRECRKPVVFRIGNDLEQLGRAVASFCRDDAELGHMPADRVRKHRSLTDQELSAAMQTLHPQQAERR